eukprot:365525-Chlamydomonas_euryale.AAC.13
MAGEAARGSCRPWLGSCRPWLGSCRPWLMVHPGPAPSRKGDHPQPSRLHSPPCHAEARSCGGGCCCGVRAWRQPLDECEPRCCPRQHGNSGLKDVPLPSKEYLKHIACCSRCTFFKTCK